VLKSRSARKHCDFSGHTRAIDGYHAQPDTHLAGDSPMAGAATLTITEANYQSEVIESTVPVLLDFWAPWCPPCLAIGPSIDQLAVEYQGKAKVGKIDVDSNRNLSLQFNVNNIPCIIVVKNGQVVGRTMGAKSKADFAKMIDAAL
jgi:thioredoxin 1